MFDFKGDGSMVTPWLARVAIVAAAMADPSHALAAASEAPFIYLHGAKPASKAEILAHGWVAQRWAWEDGEGSRCIIAKGNGKPSLNVTVQDGTAEITIWDDGEFTDGFDPDESDLTVNMNFDGKVPIDANDVAWEYGVLSYLGSDATMVAFMLARSMVVTMPDHEGSIVFDLTGFDEAVVNLLSCLLK